MRQYDSSFICNRSTISLTHWSVFTGCKSQNVRSLNSCGTTSQTDHGRQTSFPDLRASKTCLWTITRGFPVSSKGLSVHEVLPWHCHLTASPTLPLVLVVVNHRLLRQMAAQVAYILYIYPEATFEIVMIDWLKTTPDLASTTRGGSQMRMQVLEGATNPQPVAGQAVHWVSITLKNLK